MDLQLLKQQLILAVKEKRLTPRRASQLFNQALERELAQ